MSFFARALMMALAVAAVSVGSAEAGRRPDAKPAGPAEIRRAAEAAAGAAATARRTHEAAAAALAEAQTNVRDFDLRARVLTDRATALDRAARADAAAAARAIAELSLSARGAGAPTNPALGVLASQLAARANQSRAQAMEAGAALRALEGDRAAAQARLAASQASFESAAQAADLARTREAALAALADAAEAKERAQRLAARRAATLAAASARSRSHAHVAGLPWTNPVEGGRVRVAGDGKRIAIAAESGASVQAPIDGEIIYEGLFRTYGRVLILNGPEGYAFVLSGLDRVYGTTGQVVRRGDRVGVLSAPDSSAKRPPELGLELRKNGAPIPADRWVKDEIKPRKGVSIAERRKTERFQDGTRRE